uniref:TetR/AcrR family transcriptional regulator n=1 Tax=Roseihalotalea indica TaxID=2867963 RepID=A0AA49GQW8_9BACT|nr:TetR/AcrR family transcriptional regulator [Tunicatimonas sp. TK19036]
MNAIKFVLNENLYLRNPQESVLGQKIVQESIEMISRLGFEQFTFKKLARQIKSTEASIYRYFENKHKLLVYLISWYWRWLEYKIDYSIQNINSPEKKLEIAIHILASPKERDATFPEINEEALFKIVVAESDKTYLTKKVDIDNKEGLFKGYKSLCNIIAGFVKEVNPKFEFAHSLVSTMLQASHQQLFFAQHLPALTELSCEKEDMHEDNARFLRTMIFKTIS